MMKVYNLGEGNSLFNQYMAEIRDKKVQVDPLRFRRNLERIGEIMAYEISKKLEFSNEAVETPLGIANVNTLDTHPVLATILRAGLPLHNGFLNYFDRSENAFISAYRKHVSKDEFVIEFEYISSPELDNKNVILCDPMLATGSSMEVGYKALLEKGNPKHVHLAAVIASREGIEYVQKTLKAENITLWVGGIDEEMTEESYIVPGLGDAGDLAYGVKIDSKS